MKRKEAIFAVVQALIFVAVLALVALPSPNQIPPPTIDLTTTSEPANGSSASTPMTVGCSVNVPSGLALRSGSSSPLANHNQTRLSFIARPNTTVGICVTYSVEGSNTTTPSFQSSMFSAGLDTVAATYLNNANNQGNGYEYVYHSANATTGVTVDSPVFDGQTQKWKVTVEYTIDLIGVPVGYYTLGFTGNCPSLIPFAVVTDSSQVDASKFPGFFQPGSCIIAQPMLSLGIVTGYTGLTVVSITN